MYSIICEYKSIQFIFSVIFLSVSICHLSVCLSVCQYMQSVCLSVYAICLSVSICHLSVCHYAICLSEYAISLSVRICHLSVCHYLPTVCLSFCQYYMPSVCLSVFLPVHMYLKKTIVDGASPGKLTPDTRPSIANV